MAKNPCLTTQIRLDLTQLRLHWDTVVRRRVDLTTFIEKSLEGLDTDWYKKVAEAGERLELSGQIIDAVTTPTMGSILGACGKAVSVVAGIAAESSATEKGVKEKLATLAALARELKAALDQFTLSKERFRPSFEAYWACAETHRPREVDLTVSLYGTTAGGLAQATMGRVWTVKAPLLLQGPVPETYEERLLAWIIDPVLEAELTADADVVATMPAYDWRPGRPGVTVKAAAPDVAGGPLRARVMVLWWRSDPTRATITVGSHGEQSVILSVEVTVDGHTSRMGGEQALGPMLQGQLTLHKIGGALVTLPWLPTTRTWRFEHATPGSSSAKGAHCLVVVGTKSG